PAAHPHDRGAQRPRGARAAVQRRGLNPVALRKQVSALMRAVGASVVAPRFRALAAHEIAEKRPGEIVTSVDREAERRLADALAVLCPDARIVGEEAADGDPGLLDG